ncbi:MAG TPA: hypothetical protein VIL46_08915 [Gemmataceae bacterium]
MSRLVRVLTGVLAIAVAVTGGVSAAQLKQEEGKLTKATIVKVDPQKKTITLRCETEAGKEEQKTFSLEEEVKVRTADNRLSDINKLRPGEKVLTRTKEDKLLEVRQLKKEGERPGAPGAPPGGGN